MLVAPSCICWGRLTLCCVVRPKLTYACMIWGNKINTKILHQKLNSLNRLACLLTTNLTRTTPQMSLEIILNIEPLNIHIKKLGLTTYKQLENKLDKVLWCTDLTKSHLQYWAQDLHAVLRKTADDRCDTTIYDRFTKINTNSFDGNPKHIQKAETTIYTDGSKTCLLYTSPSPRDRQKSRMPSSA